MPPKQSLVPKSIWDLADRLHAGQVMPIDTGATPDGVLQPFISFIIRETDERIRLIGRDPWVSTTPGFITVSVGETVIPIIYLLFRFNNDPLLAYETVYNLAEDWMVSECNTLASQETLRFIICGVQEEHVVVTKVQPVCLQIGATVRLIRDGYDLSYPASEFHAAVKVAQTKLNSKTAVWDAFEEHGPCIEIRTAGPERPKYSPKIGYIFDEQGMHHGGILLDSQAKFEEFLRDPVREANEERREVRITNRADEVVIHFKDGELIWPEE